MTIYEKEQLVNLMRNLKTLLGVGEKLNNHEVIDLSLHMETIVQVLLGGTE